MWKEKEYDKEKESRIIEQGWHKMIARLLSQRDIHLDEIDQFINADYNSISHPHLLHDVEKAARIFCDVALGNGRVAIIGDYDADGVISSVMLSELCRVFNLEFTVFLPSRLEHGYGLNEKTIKAFSEKMRVVPALLIITDCGMNNRKQIDELRLMGIQKIIVIDHHTGQDGEISENADALVTWHLSNGLNEMCACGEVYQFIRGIRWITKKVDPIEFLSYAAIGTIADVSPVVGDNRIIIRNGLTEYALNHVTSSGLHALLKESKIHPTALTQEDVAFKIAPKINAVGRMYHPDIIYGLMVERNIDAATKIADHIITYNDERKKVQKEIENQAISIIESIQSKQPEQFSHGILVYGKDWHIGVVGIVASKLVETYHKPTLVIGQSKGIWKGSGRSVEGVNLKEIVDGCQELFEGYGGHDSAVGVTIKPDSLCDAPIVFNEACKKHFKMNNVNVESERYYDAKLKPKAITTDICDVLNKYLYPYCSPQNSEPLFMLRGVNILDVNYIEKDTWKLLKFKAEKDGFKIPYSFRTFAPFCGSEIEGRTANIVFSFPQKTADPSNYFFSFELNLVDIEFV